MNFKLVSIASLLMLTMITSCNDSENAENSDTISVTDPVTNVGMLVTCHVNAITVVFDVLLDTTSANSDSNLIIFDSLDEQFDGTVSAINTGSTTTTMTFTPDTDFTAGDEVTVTPQSDLLADDNSDALSDDIDIPCIIGSSYSY